MGLGRFGGGVGVVRYLLSAGARVTLTDLQSEELLSESLQLIDVDQLSELVLGEHREQDFTDADLVVINPGIVAHRNRYVRAAVQAKVPVTTEINLFWERCSARTIVVTGTVGKSTTATLIHTLMTASGARCRLGGNIGHSLLPEVDQLREDDWVVLELSSFQLEYLRPLQPTPDITVVTNLFPNHLDWHGTFEQYRSAKQVAIQNQSESGIAVLNGDDVDVSQWPTRGRKVVFGAAPEHHEFVQVTGSGLVLQLDGRQETLTASDLPETLCHPHSRSNLAAALATVGACRPLSRNVIDQALKSFQPLAHRLEDLGTCSGVRFVNDSKATTPEAAISGIESSSKPLVLIAGGKDKQIDITELCRKISENVKAVALIGDTALLMALLLPEYGRGLVYSTHNHLESAFRWAMKHATPGDTVLLSPGCSSDSQFLNYEDRGDQFRRLVERFSQHETE